MNVETTIKNITSLEEHSPVTLNANLKLVNGQSVKLTIINYLNKKLGIFNDSTTNRDVVAKKIHDFISSNSEELYSIDDNQKKGLIEKTKIISAGLIPIHFILLFDYNITLPDSSIDRNDGGNAADELIDLLKQNEAFANSNTNQIVLNKKKSTPNNRTYLKDFLLNLEPKTSINQAFISALKNELVDPKAFSDDLGGDSLTRAENTLKEVV